MSNQINYRRGGPGRRTENNDGRARSCGGYGHNGRIGRSKWKRLSARTERRTGKNIPPPENRPGKHRPFIRPDPDEDQTEDAEDDSVS